MIDRSNKAKLSISTQARLLGISRGSVYCLPQGISDAEPALMRQMNELHLEHPFMGARQLMRQLHRVGFEVGRLHVRTLTGQQQASARSQDLPLPGAPYRH